MVAFIIVRYLRMSGDEITLLRHNSTDRFAYLLYVFP